MKSFTSKPITFLLKISASISNKKNSLLETIIIAFESLQKNIGFSILKSNSYRLLNKVSQYILVGKDKSVVTKSYLADPTSFIKLV
jgi:hypothetical protein|tara:strand:+ start:256 stop:513 length:258 start_codon:yes stop_codon:yes gene_type:complete